MLNVLEIRQLPQHLDEYELSYIWNGDRVVELGYALGKGVTLGFLRAVRVLFCSFHCKAVDVKCGAEKEAALTLLQISWPRSVCGVSCWGLFAPERLLDRLPLTYCPDCRQQLISMGLFK